MLKKSLTTFFRVKREVERKNIYFLKVGDFMNIKRIIILLLLILFMASMVAFGAPVYVNVGPTTEFDGDIKILSEIVAEGTTVDGWETTVFFTDPTADRIITVPDFNVTLGTAITVTITDNEATAENNAIIFASGGALAGGVMGLESDGDFYYNPSDGSLHATLLYGDGTNLTGVGAAAATALTISARAAENIDKGEVVYISGATGQTPDVSLADNTDSAKHIFCGVAAETKTAGQGILIRVRGELIGVNTVAFVDGDILYLSPAGVITKVKPTSGAIEIIGYCSYANAAGKIVVLHHSAHGIHVPSTDDIVIRMGDSIGAKKVYFKDYANVEVGFIDSDGKADFTSLTLDTALIPAEGGTGVANAANNTITFTGNFTLGITLTANTTVALPTSGTLYGTLADSITSANLISSVSNETGSGVLVFATSPTLTTPVLGIASGSTIDLAYTNTVAGGDYGFQSHIKQETNALTGTLWGAYITASNNQAGACTGTIRGLEVKARTKYPGGTGGTVAVLEGISISADSKDQSVTTMRGIEVMLDGSTGGTIDEAVGIRIANNLQANKATTSYGLQIYRDSFDYTADIQMAGGLFVDSNGNELLHLDKAASAVNYLKITNSATTDDIVLEAIGDDTNIGIIFRTKGSDLSTFEKAINIDNDNVGVRAINTTGVYPGIKQKCEKASGGFAFAFSEMYARNTTSELETKLGEMGVFGSMQSGVTPPTVSFIYIGAGSDVAYDVNAMKIYPNKDVRFFGNIGIDNILSTARLHLPAGTATASTAPLKFTSGTLLTTEEAGAIEFLTDKFYGTITTGAARKTFAYEENVVVTMADEDATPDISGGTIFVSQANTAPTEITDLDNPAVGKIITIIVGNAGNPPTITDGGNFALSAGWTPDLDDTITLFVQADNDYIEISRSAN